MSGSRDDGPVRRGAVRPPPSLTPDDAPESVDVPRMEPPPASLEAMVHSARRPAASAKSGSSWLLWVLLVVVTAVISGYVMR